MATMRAMDVTDQELCEMAATALHPQKVDDFYVADVGCALVSDAGAVFTGACVGGAYGLCAEQAAAGAMVSSGTTTIRKIVAVWRDPDDESIHALAPCGRCREFLHSLSEGNLDTQVVLGPDHVTRLRDLLPAHRWHAERLW